MQPFIFILCLIDNYIISNIKEWELKMNFNSETLIKDLLYNKKIIFAWQKIGSDPCLPFSLSFTN